VNSVTKVLVVDDDHDFRNAVSVVLRSAGFEVVVARDGVGAVSTALHEHPDLVVLDLGLPGGGGVSVLEHYARFPALWGVPVVVLSGRDPEVVETAIRTHYVSRVLHKPASRAQLVDAVERALDGEVQIRSTAPARVLSHLLHRS
jgi:DNA-binding response OmpR family regulator